MFVKFASNLLQNIYYKCMLKSLACKNKEDSAIYRKVAESLEKILCKIQSKS